MPVINSVADMKDEVAEWRHELHRNPQTSYEEVFASGLVAKKLTEWGIPFKKGIAKTGIVATITGRKSDSGKALALRADMDALDIVEETNLPYASKNNGKMHACGHDGHTSILLGAAKYLKENPNFNGKVHLIFQPAEEGGAGAVKMIEEGLFNEFPVDAVYGLHNWPFLETGKIATRKGPLLASADEFAIIIRGKGGHAAMPHKTIDPVVVAAHIVTALQSIIARNVDPVDQGVVTVANFNAGTGAHNIIADTARLNGTIRAFRQDTRMFMHKRVREIAESVAKAFMAEAEINLTDDGYDPTINSDAETDFAARAAASVVGEQNVDTNTPPCMGAEDFGAYLTKRPGAFIFVGQGVSGDPKSRHNQGLHTPRYDFNDEIIPIGVSWFAKLVEQHMPIK
jgi:amidohydrolase